MMEFIVKLTALLYMYMYVSFVGTELTMMKFRVVQGQLDVKTDRTYFKQLQVRSGVMCAFECSRIGVEVCSIARYSVLNGTCSLFFWKDVHMVRLSLGVIDIDTTLLYISPSQKHIFLTSVLNGLTFEEARKYCALIGGTLGMPTDLTSSRDAGWEICACGWMVNGTAHFLVSVATQSCGTTDVWSCTFRSRFGAHCLFY